MSRDGWYPGNAGAITGIMPEEKRMPYYRWQDSDLIINCHLQPKAKTDEFSGLHGESLKIRIKAPPVDGKANAYLTKFLAKAFGVSKSRVIIISGELSREKRIKIEAPIKIPEALDISLP